MKWLLIGLVALAVIGGGVAAAQATGRLHLVALEHRLHHAKPAPAVSVDVPSITTNLGDAGGTHFAQVSLTISLRDAAAAKVFDAKLPAVEDAVIADLRQRSASDLDAAGGMSGLRASVTASLTQVLGLPGAVQAVYFTQFVVQ